MNIKVGLHYKTRDGRKATVLAEHPTNHKSKQFVGVIEGDDSWYSWSIDGSWLTESIHGNDLFKEWREPVKSTVKLYLMPTGVVFFCNPHDAIGSETVELVEGVFR